MTRSSSPPPLTIARLNSTVLLVLLDSPSFAARRDQILDELVRRGVDPATEVVVTQV